MKRFDRIHEYTSIMCENNGVTQGFFTVPQINYQIPFIYFEGTSPGKTLLITAGIHSCEYVGIESALRFSHQLRCSDISGQILILPSVNFSGLKIRQTTLVPEDNSNLNRFFPGRIDGTFSEQIAYFISEYIYPLADFYVDLHSGNQFEYLTPHLYYSSFGPKLLTEKAVNLIDVKYAIKSSSDYITISSSAKIGIPSLLIERGSCGTWTENEVNDMVKDLFNITKYLNILNGDVKTFHPFHLPEYDYIDNFPSGLWYPFKKAGEFFVKGENLGVIKDIFGHELKSFQAPYNGVMLYLSSTLWVEDRFDLMAFGRTE